MGTRGPKPKEYCIRGHVMEDWSTLPANPSGRRCRACNRAISTAWNMEKRHGIVLSPSELSELADEKFTALAIEMGQPAYVRA